MTYRDQLNTPEWKTRRRQIIERDSCLCQICHNANIAKGAMKVESLDINRSSENLWLYFKHNSDIHFKQFCLSDSVINTSFEFAAGKRTNVIFREEDQKPIVLGVQRFKQDLSKHLLALEQRISEWRIKLNIAHSLDVNSFQNKINELEKERSEINIILNSYSKEENDWLIVPQLQVHHLYYQRTKMAWEYSDEALITLCPFCHSEWHKNNPIEERDQQGRIIRSLTPCNRCNGVGYIPPYDYVQKGICFRCWGTQYEEYINN